MKIEDIEDSLISKWDYLGWKNNEWFEKIPSESPQKDWNQTFMTRINELSAAIHMGTCIYNEKTDIIEELGPADTIIINENFLEIMNSLEFFNTEKNSLGRKQVIIDNEVENDVVFVLKKDVSDDYERKNRTVGAIRIENYE